ncbi:MBL fold metallo-hydrolase [Mesorhizobium tianshanense]|uniref:Metallo-beta-lactamase superfamily protein n=1 Tax=Mesorhizobium tianshanense TaxID=39844 RepID=A0A562PBV4_9HYPH|nr:MBL fold metallo-hydrolase [Mesorhizobium tianshanense]TWI41888.1 metallo-beta-lactamase superfamily protein [Mesorhizobium tianshanense]
MYIPLARNREKMSPIATNAHAVDRRKFLSGVAAALLAAPLSALATRRSSAIGHISLGDGDLTVVSDGFMQLPVGFSFPGAPQDDLKMLLSDAGLSADTLKNDCNITLLRRGDRLAIFDVGAGSNFVPTTGKLLKNLAETGIEPKDVTDVIFTHAHPDHLWGLVDEFDELVFSNARYQISAGEWDFWSSPKAVEVMPEDRKAFAVGARNRFAAIEDVVSFFKPGDEIFPGVEAVDTQGHTPGHVSFAVHGGTEPVLIVGDAIVNVAISLARPDWPMASDQDPQAGARTRSWLLDRIATEKMRLIAFHFPHPASGLIERKDNTYRFVPA